MCFLILFEIVVMAVTEVVRKSYIDPVVCTDRETRSNILEIVFACFSKCTNWFADFVSFFYMISLNATRCFYSPLFYIA